MFKVNGFVKRFIAIKEQMSTQNSRWKELHKLKTPLSTFLADNKMGGFLTME